MSGLQEFDNHVSLILSSEHILQISLDRYQINDIGKILLHSADMYLYIQMHIGLHLHLGQQIGVNRAKSSSERVAYCS